VTLSRCCSFGRGIIVVVSVMASLLWSQAVACVVGVNPSCMRDLRFCFLSPRRRGLDCGFYYCGCGYVFATVVSVVVLLLWTWLWFCCRRLGCDFAAVVSAVCGLAAVVLTLVSTVVLLSCVLVVVMVLDLTVMMPAGAALAVVLTFGYALISVSDLLRFSFCLSPVCGSQTDLNPISHPYQMPGGATS